MSQWRAGWLARSPWFSIGRCSWRCHSRCRICVCRLPCVVQRREFLNVASTCRSIGGVSAHLIWGPRDFIDPARTAPYLVFFLGALLPVSARQCTTAPRTRAAGLGPAAIDPGSPASSHFTISGAEEARPAVLCGRCAARRVHRSLLVWRPASRPGQPHRTCYQVGSSHRPAAAGYPARRYSHGGLLAWAAAERLAKDIRNLRSQVYRLLGARWAGARSNMCWRHSRCLPSCASCGCGIESRRHERPA
jgi:hypothetical protein